MSRSPDVLPGWKLASSLRTGRTDRRWWRRVSRPSYTDTTREATAISAAQMATTVLASIRRPPVVTAGDPWRTGAVSPPMLVHLLLALLSFDRPAPADFGRAGPKEVQVERPAIAPASTLLYEAGNAIAGRTTWTDGGPALCSRGAEKAGRSRIVREADTAHARAREARGRCQRVPLAEAQVGVAGTGGPCPLRYLVQLPATPPPLALAATAGQSDRSTAPQRVLVERPTAKPRLHR